MKTGRESPTAMVRLPAELKSWLQHKAVDNHRSLGGEIAYRLEQSRAAEMSQQQGAQQ